MASAFARALSSGPRDERIARTIAVTKEISQMGKNSRPSAPVILPARISINFPRPYFPDDSFFVLHWQVERELPKSPKSGCGLWRGKFLAGTNRANGYRKDVTASSGSEKQRALNGDSTDLDY